MLRVGLGVALRELRKEGEPRLSQAELSARAGLPSNAIGDMERGGRTIKGEELKSICKVLGLQIKVFMERVKKTQLRAMGEPEADEEPDGAASAGLPDFYLTVALAGRTPEEVIQMLHKAMKAGSPVKPEKG
ncbi:MAG: helix-turn-helix domain-containing protein [Thermoanaerobaculia bacterium]